MKTCPTLGIEVVLGLTLHLIVAERLAKRIMFVMNKKVTIRDRP